jgi:signal transduction histidine kinase
MTLSNLFIEFFEDALSSRGVDELCEKLLMFANRKFNTYSLELLLKDFERNNINIYNLQKGIEITRSESENDKSKQILDSFKGFKTSGVRTITFEENNGYHKMKLPFFDQGENVFGSISLIRKKKFSVLEESLFKDSIIITSRLLLWLYQRTYVEQQIMEKDIQIAKLNTQIKDLHSLNMKTLTQFVAGVAHEINNPLASLKGGAEGLKDNISDMKEILVSLTKGKEYDDNEFNYLMMEGIPDSISAIVTSADRLRDLILNLKQFSRLGIADISNLDLNRRIVLMLDHFKDDIEKNKIIVETKLRDQLKIRCFSQEITMLLNQLMLNAIFYATRAEGNKKILICSKDKGNEVEISFLDTGCGILYENEDKIFQPFFTTKNIGEGMGLGLSVCYGIIMDHNGKIFVDKTREEGEAEYSTKMTIVLPKTISEG